jgi:hypothetical protein
VSSERKSKDEPQARRRRLDQLVSFPSDLFWFLRKWKPISISFNSPRLLWRMAMNRRVILACVLRGREEIEARNMAYADREAALKANPSFQGTANL